MLCACAAVHAVLAIALTTDLFLAGEPKAKNRRRSDDYAKNQNRPILLLANGGVIGEPFARYVLGFRVATVVQDGLQVNITSLEGSFQRTLDDAASPRLSIGLPERAPRESTRTTSPRLSIGLPERAPRESTRTWPLFKRRFPPCS
jgi:hypothetical protein